MNILHNEAKNSAKGQYLGFAIQPVRACIRLLEEPEDAFVSLEYIDDVGVHYSDGRFLLEQDKSAHSHNPLSDGAKDLWKTIGDWIDYVSGNTLRYQDGSFLLYVTPQKSGNFAQRLDSAKNHKDALGLRADVEEYFNKNSPRGHARSGIQKFLALKETDIVSLMCNTSIFSENDPVDVLREKLKLLGSDSLLDEMCAAAIGLAKESFDHKIKTGSPQIISTSAFVSQLRNFLQKFNVEKFYPSLQPKPETEQISAFKSLSPTFLRQLEIINIDEKNKDRAIADFLLTSGDKSLWAEKGIITEETLHSWDDDLQRHHGLVQAEISSLHADIAPEKRGNVVYSRCANHQAKLQGKEVPGHFVNGSYNALSNDKIIGWHPDYEEILSEDE